MTSADEYPFWFSSTGPGSGPGLRIVTRNVGPRSQAYRDTVELGVRVFGHAHRENEGSPAMRELTVKHEGYRAEVLRGHVGNLPMSGTPIRRTSPDPNTRAIVQVVEPPRGSHEHRFGAGPSCEICGERVFPPE